MISHKNVIANTLQMSTYESNYKSGKPESLLAVLPMSHSYALIVTGHSGVYRGYNAVVLPGFDLVDVLETVQKHSIETLWMVSCPRCPHMHLLCANDLILTHWLLGTSHDNCSDQEPCHHREI